MRSRLAEAFRDVQWSVGFAVILLLGVFVRVYPSGTFYHVGFDEGLYREYLNFLTKGGLADYPSIVEGYLAEQRKLPTSILPPLRFLYIFVSYLWRLATGADSLHSLQCVACLFSILTLLLSFFFAFRLGGKECALAVLAFVACAPTQIHMSQYALVDGFFTFWALLTLWLLWECLHNPNRNGLLLLYGLSFACMVMTKENSFFVFFAIAGILCVNRWLKFGEVSRSLLLMTVAGPLAGVCVLVLLAGGPANFFETYHLSVTKNLVHPYAIRTGDGPWYRYIAELLLVGPVILLLAIGRLSQLNKSRKEELFLGSFIGFSYLLMANVKYGMNLRYTNMWDMPLRYMAWQQLAALGANWGRRRTFILVLCVVGICAMELNQYLILFVQFRLYELVPEGVLYALKIIKH